MYLSFYHSSDFMYLITIATHLYKLKEYINVLHKDVLLGHFFHTYF